VVQDVASPLWYGQVHFAVSSAGTIAYVPSTAGGLSTLVWVDRTGKVEQLPLLPARYGSPGISPDGKRLLFTRQDEKNKIWVYDLERKILRRLLDEKGEEWLPVWSPDGRKIAFNSTRHGSIDGTMFWKSVDSDEPAERLVETENWPCPHSFSADGKLLAYRAIGDETSYDIWLLSMEGARNSERFLQTLAYETWPKFSPDGKWIAYQSRETGQMEVYVRPLRDGDGKALQISNSGGEYPLWSPNGTEIFYSTGDKIMSVAFQGDTEVVVGMPEVLFEWSIMAGFDFLYGFDIAPDGNRFLMIQGGEPQSITVVLNWIDELKHRVQE
jgi:Tol biopolymer transport system component